ncbi:MAG: tRNA (adenosine(37)-N6)-threonylcarbamoyltransferase complex transferase subunit TsaD [Myxococcales bacterium]|nr:tRNA (adenosine(37)-N6)-threonylcarbamoyltransferase complex transferase subunit TsaD [Myxococcales bacterium]MCB9750293.1 tRNA (adenosine(37)-N6)-threonylcarbamoyltransferase complex transferase subunit TsaD [Myxococcales bacterium]
MSDPRILAIESSCDETAAAIVRGFWVESSVVASQIEVHARFGGVVPELASRHHLGAVVPVVREAMKAAGVVELSELDGLAVTAGPGLVGALLVGVQMARGMAAVSRLPLFGVHHMEGHIVSAFLGDAVDGFRRAPEEFAPHVALLVSGGHTEIVHVAGFGDYTILGATRDDAAGEAYDKVAKLLGLGYPGGPVIDRLAAEGDPHAIDFPRAMTAKKHEFEFSFSGLKTAVLVHTERGGMPRSRAELTDLCASFQAAVVDVLTLKARRACRQLKLPRLHVVGGVSANRGLRARLEQIAEEDGIALRVPPLRYCGDNAAMIAAAAAARARVGQAPGVELFTSRAIDDPRVRVARGVES